MGKHKVIVWSYFCDQCDTDEGVTYGDYGVAHSQLAADQVMRDEEGWYIARGAEGRTYCPDCRTV